MLLPMSEARSGLVRAGVFIGVARSGGLPSLQDACQGARDMHTWAVAQGIVDGKYAKLITDEDQKVGVDRIFEGIDELLAGAGIDQLVVYFAGHGVNINRNEHWLLSDAPRNPNAAVNVTGSVELARYCGTRYVVFISDACRSAPEGLQAQGVRGQDVFPNDGVSDRARPVDQFFACVLGRTAAELADPKASAASYKAVYTGALLDALHGYRPEILDKSGDAADPARYLRPVPLEAYLEREVPARIRALGLHYRYSQQPEALIMAHPGWLSRIMQVPSAPLVRFAHQPRGPGPLSELRGATADLLDTAMLGSDEGRLRREVWKVEQRLEPDAASLAGQIRDTLAPFGPDNFEIRCGIKVRGTTIDDCFTPLMRREPVSDTVVRVHPYGHRAASVAVRFGTGAGAVVPVFDGYLTALTVRDGELVDVGFEPSANIGPGRSGPDQLETARAVKAVLAAAARHSRLALPDKLAALRLARLADSLPTDPALLMYSAYALRDWQEETDIAHRQSTRVSGQFGATLFDLALLGRQLVGQRLIRGRVADTLVVPFTPMLARGWALLDAHRFTLDPALTGVDTTMLDSTWSLYTSDGYARLRAALASGDVR